MHKLVSMAELYPMIAETLAAGGCISFTSTGVSMLPMLGDRRDTVTLEPVTNPIRVNDVVLYRRKGGQFVLHRIVGMESNGDFSLCGDNQFILEHHISRQQMIGRLQSFTHKGHSVFCNSTLYKTYVYMLPLLRFLKHGRFIFRRYAAALKRRIRRLMNENR